MLLEEFFSTSCVVGKHVQLFQFDLYAVEYTIEHYLNHQIDLMKKKKMMFVDVLKKKEKKEKVQVNVKINDRLQKVKYDRVNDGFQNLQCLQSFFETVVIANKVF